MRAKGSLTHYYYCLLPTTHSAQVKFSENNATITLMCSLDGEVVTLTKPVPVTYAVESWLQLLNTMMRTTLANESSEMLQSGNLDIENKPSQATPNTSYSEPHTDTYTCSYTVPLCRTPLPYTIYRYRTPGFSGPLPRRDGELHARLRSCHTQRTAGNGRAEGRAPA